MFKRISVSILSAVLLGSTALQAQSPTIPSTIPFQGRLSHQSTGGNVQASVKLTVALYPQSTGGASVWSEIHASVSVNGGVFKVELGSVNGFPTKLFDNSTLYLAVQVNTDAEMSPRFALTSQGYSRVAANAKDVKGANIHPNTVTIGTKKVIDASGKWIGDPTGLTGPTGAPSVPT